MTAAIGLVGWHGVVTLGPNGGIDSPAYASYAGYLASHHSLPPPASETYEYQAPPLYEVVATGAQWVGKKVESSPVELGARGIGDAMWLALVGAAAALMTASSRRRRIAGTALLVGAAVWALDDAFALVRAQPWSAGRLISFAESLALIGLTAAIAHELWPQSPRRVIGAAAFSLAYPIVFRLGVLFHPEMTLAFLTAFAILVVLRAERRNWPAKHGLLVGVLCGLGALTRQSAVVVVVSLLLAAALAGRKRARGFVAAAVGAIVLVAGPWWGYAYHAWGNPLQGNLERPGFMLVHGEPVSRFISFPIVSVILHPYRPHLENRLLPQLHADLWSDWFGAIHSFWTGQSHLAVVTASTQSGLGLVGDLLGVGGLAAFGVPAVVRLARRRPEGRDFGFALLALLAALAFAAFVAQIVRYPQVQGDEIKASYLLFTTPCWSVFSVAAWSAAATRSRTARLILPAWAALYALSYAAAMYAVLA
jgi:4-amino-4-deoxy-L-arabinose transferase-like glycosyltransferase